ncbi:MAG: protein-disulfide reductase DsbD family protein [Luteolibacter sp.]
MRFLWLFVLLLTQLCVTAQFSLQPDAVASRARLLSEQKAIAPGQPFTVLLEIEHPQGWHSYYQNTGGVELPPSIEWSLPDGLKAGDIQWPAPSVKDGFLGKSFIYDGTLGLLVDITPDASLRAGESVTLRADASWQICKESCISENKSFTLTLPVAEQAQSDPAVVDAFARARAAMPIHDPSWQSSVSSGPDAFLVTIRGAKDKLEFNDFVPDQAFVKSAADGGSIRRENDTWTIRLPRQSVDAFGDPIESGNAISGILLGAQPHRMALTQISAPAPVAAPWSRYLPILGGMLLGGLILNLMPCVFPVIGLKIMGFVQQAGTDRKKIAVHGLVFTAGVLLSFGVLSSVLYLLRTAAGDTIGWGYQLQEPWVVCALMLLMFLLALNMAGVFEIGVSATSVGGHLQAKHGFGGSFFSGVLATVVATPCSAPFLGAAIGAAVALPALQFFVAFAAMGIGLSLPYLVLSAFPKLIDALPRPGAWMESFKQGMSFLLFATAGYLLWIYGGLIDLDALLNPLIGLTCIAIAAWIHGRWNLPHRKRSTRAAAIGCVALFAVSGFLLTMPPKESALSWEPWTAASQDQHLADGIPVYIDFTAKWCATCQVNKKRAYTPEVIKLMQDKGIVAMKADKTRANPEIEAALSRYGRSAIPVNVLLVPGKEPVIFPELLSPNHLIEAFEMLE